MNYRNEVLRLCPNIATDRMGTKLALGALGLAGETGEVVDLVKKNLFHGKEMDREKIIKELGDVRWYLEYLLITLDLTMDEVEVANVEKLRLRFPNGFNIEDANKRRDEQVVS